MGRDKEKDSFHEGKRDGRSGRFRPQGFVEQIGDAILGKSSERREYERGVDAGRKSR